MSLIRFNNMNKYYSVKLTYNVNTDDCKRLTIEFQREADLIEANISNGFIELNEYNFVKQSDYSDMKYIYEKRNNKTVVLSNLESDKYVTPIIPEIVKPEIVPDKPVTTLKDTKFLKINELSSVCKTQIIGGVSIDIDGVKEHFSYAIEDQQNIEKIFNMVSKTKNGAYYHQDGGGCKYYSAEQLIKLYVTETTNQMHHSTYFNQLKMYINNMDNINEVNAVYYGQELTGQYLETYNMAMEQHNKNIALLLSEDL